MLVNIKNSIRSYLLTKKYISHCKENFFVDKNVKSDANMLVEFNKFNILHIIFPYLTDDLIFHKKLVKEIFRGFRATIELIKIICQLNSLWQVTVFIFKHFFSLINDAFKTKIWIDKLKLWFMPTGYRPQDVVAKYPIKTVTNVIVKNSINNLGK